VVAYAQGNVVRHRVYRANDPTPSWSGAIVAATLDVGNDPNWLRLRSDDGGRLVLGLETVNEEVRTVPYDGNTGTWGAVSAAHTTAAFGNADDHRAFDLVHDRAASAGGVMLVYSDTSGLRYRRSADSGATWGASRRSTTPALPTGCRRRSTPAASSTW
jgi:hypothetical protein